MKKYTKYYRPDSFDLANDLAYVIVLAGNKAHDNLERCLAGWRENDGTLRDEWRRLLRRSISNIRRVKAVEAAYQECGRIVID